MRRVYGVWFLRQMAPLVMTMPFSLAIALWLTAKEFFVARVVENLIASAHNGGIWSVSGFVADAFYHASHSSLAPLAIIGFSSALFLFLGYRLIRNFTQLTLVRI